MILKAKRIDISRRRKAECCVVVIVKIVYIVFADNTWWIIPLPVKQEIVGAERP